MGSKDSDRLSRKVAPLKLLKLHFYEHQLPEVRDYIWTVGHSSLPDSLRVAQAE